MCQASTEKPFSPTDNIMENVLSHSENLKIYAVANYKMELFLGFVSVH